jgi:hypothetical protein
MPGAEKKKKEEERDQEGRARRAAAVETEGCVPGARCHGLKLEKRTAPQVLLSLPFRRIGARIQVLI